MTLGFDIREITDTVNVAATFRLRFDIWNSETELKAVTKASAEIRDAHEDHARHWAAFRNEEMVASARMCVHKHLADSPDSGVFLGIELNAPVATLNRLVVHASARGVGLAARFDESRISAAIDEGARSIVGTFPEYRISALEKRGFRLTGQRWIPAYAESILCYAMVLTL
jgi:GNAT superfamily N-acetyltransferase